MRDPASYFLNAIIGRDIATDQCWGGHDAIDDAEDGSFDVMALSLTNTDWGSGYKVKR
ncbi:MAG: hypothetical protein GY874_17575 [Desulfobacteraceae bacterium]|nr:hypothetical protein [Desulfobacteraceae bacterium]